MAVLPERDLQAFWERLEDVYDYFKSRGVSDEVAAAILGNAAREASGFWDAVNKVTDEYGKVHYYYGGVQHEQETYDWIKSNYGGYEKKHQIQYLADGILGTLPDIKSKRGALLDKRFKDFMKMAKTTKSPSKLAYYWEDIYEISGKSRLDERQQCAEYFYKQMQKRKSKNPKNNNQGNQNNYMNKNTNGYFETLYPDFSEPMGAPLKGRNVPFLDTSYNAEDVNSEFDLPLYASNFKNGGKLIKKYQFGGTLASNYIRKYFNPNRPNDPTVYVNLADAQKAGLQFTNDTSDQYSGAYFDYSISNKNVGEDDYNREFKNNIDNQQVIPEQTYVAIDPYNRIINNENLKIILNNPNELIPVNGYMFDTRTNQWTKVPSASTGQFIDQDMLDQAEQAARFLSDRGFEHAWRMDPVTRIEFAKDVQRSDAVGEGAVFGGQVPGLAKSAYGWLTGTNAGRAFTSSMFAGEAFDIGTRAMTGKSFGKYFADRYGGSPILWGMANPGYLFGGDLAAPIKEVGSQLASNATKGIYDLVSDYGKNLINKWFTPRRTYPLESAVYNMETSDPIKAAAEQAEKTMQEQAAQRKEALINLKNNLPEGAIDVYTDNEAKDVKMQLAAFGFKPTEDPATGSIYLGQINRETSPSDQILVNWLKYNLKNALVKKSKPNYPAVLVRDKSGFTFKWPTSSEELIESLPQQPLFVTVQSADKEGARAAVNRITSGRMHAEIGSGILGSLKSIKQEFWHEIFGHGANNLAEHYTIPELGNITLKEAYEAIAKNVWNTKLAALQYRGAKPLSWEDVQAVIMTAKDGVLKKIKDQENISLQDLLKMSETNSDQFKHLISKYIDEMSNKEFINLLLSDGSLYSSQMERFLPGVNGLATQSKYFKFMTRPDKPSNLQYLYDTLKLMQDHNISWSEREANEYLQYLKVLMKDGLSIALPVLAANGLLNNNQNE